MNPISFPNLRLALTSDESRAINSVSEPKVILSASGMCEAGRIKHHLKHNLWRKDATILFVGYQAEGTLGRSLLDGAKEVTLFGEPIRVEAEIVQLSGISGHADREGLVAWAAGFTKKPEKVFVVHGDDSVVQIFADLLHEKLGYDAYAPYSGTIFDLGSGAFVKETTGIPYVRKDAEGAAGTASKAAGPYARLENALKRLTSVVHACRGIPNKELARFADQIDAMCEKWKR